MSGALAASGFVTREEYYRWCEAQPRGRYERVDGQIVAMSPERIAHVRTKTAMIRALQDALAGSGLECEALGDGVSVQTGESDYQPDALVNCGERLDGGAVAASNPVIIVEVLSPSTASTDTGGKLADYFRLPSVAHYLIVHPTKRLVIHHRRASSGIETRIVVEGEIRMDPPGISIGMDSVYGRLTAGS
jgi:Uma2 family endonuclease